MWAPKGKSLPLQAVVDPARDEVLVSSAEMASSLRSHWAPVFAPRSTSQRHLDQCLDKHVHVFDWSLAAPPSMGSIAHVIHGAKPTAPGPDCLPYAAWQQSSLSRAI
eukprot:5571384-Pyramimonas_sp.AAC.1